jgi:hypothetical protein
MQINPTTQILAISPLEEISVANVAYRHILSQVSHINLFENNEITNNLFDCYLY